MNKISIIVPVYNTETYLKKCLDSLINQKYENYEIIIINDGSTDNSEEIIKDYSKKYSKLVKYYKKDNTGIADTRNYGIEKSTGDYILFVDSDDYISTSLLDDIKEYINSGIDLIKFKIKKVNEKDEEIEKIDGACFETVSGQEGFNKLYSTDVILESPCCYIIKKDLFKTLKFKVDTYHEDFGIIPLIIVASKTMISINEYEYYYVQRNDSITRNDDYNKNKKRALDLLSHYDNMISQINKMNLKKETMENIKIYYTNAILLTIESLNKNDSKQYIKEIKKRKMTQNIKVRNIKQFIKKIILSINIKLYLKLR